MENSFDLDEDKWLMELIKEHELEGDHERIPLEEVFKRCGLEYNLIEKKEK